MNNILLFAGVILGIVAIFTVFEQALFSPVAIEKIRPVRTKDSTSSKTRLDNAHFLITDQETSGKDSTLIVPTFKPLIEDWRLHQK